MRDTVFLVEDDKSYRNSLVKLFNLNNINVVEEESVSKSFFKLDNQKFKCIILDMRLKDGKGTEILDFIKDNKKGFNFNTPVIVSSGSIDVILLKKIAPHTHSIFAKPFKTDLLIDRVKNIIKG